MSGNDTPWSLKVDSSELMVRCCFHTQSGNIHTIFLLFLQIILMYWYSGSDENRSRLFHYLELYVSYTVESSAMWLKKNKSQFCLENNCDIFYKLMFIIIFRGHFVLILLSYCVNDLEECCSCRVHSGTDALWTHNKLTDDNEDHAKELDPWA